MILGVVLVRTGDEVVVLVEKEEEDSDSEVIVEAVDEVEVMEVLDKVEVVSVLAEVVVVGLTLVDELVLDFVGRGRIESSGGRSTAAGRAKGSRTLGTGTRRCLLPCRAFISYNLRKRTKERSV